MSERIHFDFLDAPAPMCRSRSVNKGYVADFSTPSLNSHGVGSYKILMQDDNVKPLCNTVAFESTDYHEGGYHMITNDVGHVTITSASSRTVQQ